MDIQHKCLYGILIKKNDEFVLLDITFPHNEREKAFVYLSKMSKLGYVVKITPELRTVKTCELAFVIE